MSEARSRHTHVLTSGFSGAAVLMTGTRGIWRHYFAPRVIPRPSMGREKRGRLTDTDDTDEHR